MKTQQLLALVIATATLFNGKNLDGWEQHSGEAKYTVVDGVLTGESVSGSGNSFMCTKQTFANFELELEYQCEALLNSGVMFRAECFPEARTLNVAGKEIKVAADRVHGYQCEIDMDTARGRMWTGGIYDEARRGWLFPMGGEKGEPGKAFSEQGRKITKNGEWNKLRIVANGPSIKTWLNGELRAKKVGLKVSFRNVRLREIKSETNQLTEPEKAAGWKLLWDGKTTDGWRSAKAENFPANGWTIKDGLLTVHDNKGGESTGGGDIITRERYSSFELVADFRITPGANSGIKYFVQPGLSPIDKVTGKKTAVGSAIGCEFQILDDALHPDAKLGRDGNRTIGSLYDLKTAAATKQPNAIGEWNTARIVARGPHVEHWLNGAKILEYDRNSPEFRTLVAASKYKNIPDFGEWPDGHILLQDHGNRVSFRNLKIRTLSNP
ncbi:MAG: DUF1080 domain-containing protein [Verrucomicrobia bacterium]|nr:DUF1080 domain-containing protein [Verrucomicrobiota bacterium]